MTSEESSTHDLFLAQSQSIAHIIVPRGSHIVVLVRKGWPQSKQCALEAARPPICVPLDVSVATYVMYAHLGTSL